MIHDLKIDNHFVRFGDTSFAVDKITSFRIAPKKKVEKGSDNQLLFSLVAIIAGIAGVAAVTERHFAAALGGIGAAAFCAYLALKTKDRPPREYTEYTLFLTTNAGEVAAVKTESAEDISRIKASLESAMTAKLN
jgi:hypothetical protein